MEKLTNLVTTADFVGIQLKPTLNGNNRIKSFLGGLISLVAMSTILFGFVYFGLSMIWKDKPIMNIVQEMRSQAVINSVDNPFMFVVYDRYGRILQNDEGFKRAIKIETVMYQIRPDPDIGFTTELFNGSVKPCDATEISQTVNDQLIAIGHSPQIALCQDSSSFKNAAGESFGDKAYVKNRYAELDSNFVNFRFTHCDEEADPGCGDYLNTVERPTIIFYMLNYYIDQTDYDNPIKIDLTQRGYSISKTVAQSVYISSIINEIVTDSSLFLSETKRETYYTLMNPSISVGEYQPNQRLMLEFYTSVEKIANINQRRYMKIPELLANMGGFMKAAIVVGNLVSYLYSEYIYYLAVEKLEVKHKRKLLNSTQAALSSNSASKSSVNIARPKQIKVELPSFSNYLTSFLSKTKRHNINRSSTFKYLELNYLIDCLLFVEEISRKKENNFIKQEQSYFKAILDYLYIYLVIIRYC